ncbi:hypothetical protein FA13DRAFT_1741195 [Coprinellus micaceus]|uniref:Uncharacterized protein n=1 Tax=Coprinellus micaceus TaxID=71717 RepID=A0A4Y7SLJ6_COPMI|nr:hypothetical protein FA13DRAFT_1741195 [Coprinellus micaceus]
MDPQCAATSEDINPQAPAMNHRTPRSPLSSPSVPPRLCQTSLEASPSTHSPTVFTTLLTKMRFATLFSIATLFASFHTTFADTPTIEELIEISGVATGPSEFNEEGYRNLAALKAAAHIPTPTTPETRSEAGVMGRMTNAERLANGLPLKSPARRRRPRTPLNRLEARVQASPGPSQTNSGRLALRDASGQRVGYVMNTLLNNAQLGTTTDVSKALRVSVTFDSLLSNPSQLQVTLLNSNVVGYPLLALIQGRDNTNQDLSAGSFHYVYSGGAAEPGSGPGSTGIAGQNTYTAVSRIAQTDVWTFDRSTFGLTPAWINSNGDAKTFSLYTQSTAIYGLVDPAAFSGRYPSPLSGPYTYYIELDVASAP